jgi:hypothetical protein
MTHPLIVRLLSLGACAFLASGCLIVHETKAPVPRPPAAAAAAPVAGSPAPLRVAARPADVASPEAIVAALYATISGAAGQARDWDRMHSLFAPEGKMAAVGARPGGAFGLRSMSVDDYIGRVSKPFAESGFYETELARTSERFGQIVHVFSTYESRHAPGEAKPFQRGVNSIQLFHDGSRWWILSVLWRAEDEQLALPERYLKPR